MIMKSGSQKTLFTFFAIIALGIAFAGGYSAGLSRDTEAPEAEEVAEAPDITVVVDYVTPDYIDSVAPYMDVLKAFELGHGHYLLTDLSGVAFTVYDTLEHGSNYIAYQGLEYELLGYQKTDWDTYDERAFEDVDFLAEEIEAFRDSL